MENVHKQVNRIKQLLNSLLQKPLAPTHLFSTLEAEFTNLDSIYASYKPLILAATQLLKKEPSFYGVLVSNKCMRSSLLPFLGDALIWLTGTAMTKDVSSNKRVNQLIATQPRGNLSPCHPYSKCHHIYHSGEQATHQHSNECSRKDTPGCHNTLQHHTFIVQQPELPADCTLHSLHSSKPQKFIILCERNWHQAEMFTTNQESQ